MAEWLKAWLQPQVLIVLAAAAGGIAGAWRAISIRLAAIEKMVVTLRTDVDEIFDRQASPWAVERLAELKTRLNGRDAAAATGFQRLASAEADIKNLRERQDEIIRRLEGVPLGRRR